MSGGDRTGGVSLGVLAGGVIVLTILLLVTLGAPISRPAPVPAPRPTMAPPSVSGGGVTLASASVELPADDGRFPAGANADLVDANCTACHSAAMALTQPRLTADQWQAEVTKMREVYHAPVAEKDVPAIVAYLAAMPGQGAPSPAAPATQKPG